MNQRIRSALASTSLWALVAFATASCASSVQLEATVEAPGVSGSIGVTIKPDEGGQPTAAVQADDALAGYCASVTFADEAGKETGSSTHTLDPTGAFSVAVPEGSASMALVIAECPEEESPGAQIADFGLSSSGEITPGSSGVGTMRPKETLSRTQVLVLPASLAFTPGFDHRYVSLELTGTSPQDSMALASSILEHGLETRIPDSARVLEFLTITPDESGGARIRSATTGEFLSWNLDANYGGWTADLYGNSLHYEATGWDIVETLVPVSALDTGSQSGVTYANRLSIRFRTTSDPSTSRTTLDLAAQI